MNSRPRISWLQSAAIAAEYALVIDMCLFAGLGIIGKHVAKVCFFTGVVLFIFTKALKERRYFFVRFIDRTVVIVPLGVFLVVTAVSMLVSRTFGHSLEIWLQRFLPYAMVFVIGSFIGQKRRNLLAVLSVFLLAVTFFSVGGVIDFLRAEERSRLFTSFGKVSLFGAGNYFLYSLPFFISLVLFVRRRSVLFPGIICLVPVLAAFFLHFARNTWIALPAAVLIVLLGLCRKKRGVLSVLAAYGALVFFVPVLHERLFSFNTLSPETWGRLNIWKAVWAIFLQHPILGAGPGSCELLMRHMATSIETFKDVTLHAHPHNMYLEVMAENGIIGLLAFLGVFGVYIASLTREVRRRFDAIHTAFLIMVISVLIAELVSSTILVGIYLAGLFWFLLGMSAGWLQHTRPLQGDNNG